MTQEASETLGLTHDSILGPDGDGKDNDSDGFRGNKRENAGPPTKVVIRRLPSTMTFDSFMEQISPVPDNDYLYFVRADMSLGQHAFARAYINFLNEEDVFIFKDKFDGYVFVDQKGNEYSAVVEFSPFQKIPKKKSKKKDTKCGTIEQDADYIKFVESLQNPKEVHLPTAENYLEEIESRQRELKANNGVLRVTTPLIEHIKQKKAEKLRMREEKREERKRREIEKKRMREEERKRRKAEKDKFCKDGDRLDDKSRVEPTVKLLKNPEREKEKSRDAEKERPDINRMNRYQDASRLEKSKVQPKEKEWDRDRDRYKRHEEEDRDRRQKDRQRRFRDRGKRDKDEHGYQTRVLSRDECKTVSETDADRTSTTGRSGKDGYGAKHDTKGRADWHRTDYKSRRDEKPRDGWGHRDNRQQQVSSKDRDERRGKSYEKSRETSSKKDDGSGKTTADSAKTKSSAEAEPDAVSPSGTTEKKESGPEQSEIDVVEDAEKQLCAAETVPSDAKGDAASNEEGYGAEDSKYGDKEGSQNQRPDRRIRNKDRPSIALYRPGMRRLCTQKDGSQKDGLVSPTSSSSPSPVPQVGGAKLTEGASFEEADNPNSGKSSESGNSVTDDK